MEKVIIYGAGAMLRPTIKLLEKDEIVAVVDSYQYGRKIEGFQIQKPERELLYSAEKIIISSSKFFDEIVNDIEYIEDRYIYVVLQNQVVSKLEYYKIGYSKRNKINNERDKLKNLIESEFDEKLFRLSNNAKLYTNREAALYEMPKGVICAEVGVAYGDFSEKILEHMHPKYFWAIDYFSQETQYKNCGYDKFIDSSESHENIYRGRFRDYIEKNTMGIKQGISWEVLEEFEDDYFDYVYLDADHRYESVIKDVEVLYRKCKSGAIIQFNDYTDIFLNSLSFPGVRPAVYNFLKRGQAEIIGYCLHQFGNDDIILKVIKNSHVSNRS